MPSAAMRSTASAAVCTDAASSSRTALGGRRSTCDAPWAALGRLAHADAHPEEVRRVQVRLHGAQPVVPGQAAPRLEPHRARRQVELVVHDHDGGRLVDPEPRGQRAHGRPRTRSCRSSGRPAPPAGRASVTTRRPGLHALLGPQRRAVALGQQLDRVGPGVVQAPGELRSGVAQPDDQQVRRCPPALGPGEGAAQGLALFAAGLGRRARRTRRRLGLGTFLALALARLLLDVTTRGGCPMATAVSGSMSVVTPAGSARSETRTWPPMVSSLMSTSSAVGMSAGRALMARVNICWSTRPSPWCTSSASPTRTIGTSALMTSSRRTIRKSTWVTVCATGWRCISRARAR